MKRELVTGLLTLSLLASMLPANALAAEGTSGAPVSGQVQTLTEGAGEDGVQTENAADIDGTQYATLAEAVAQAEEGATIRLLRDVELDASGLVNGQGALTLSKDLTLDGSGHTVRAKAGTFAVSGDNGGGPSLINLQDGAEVTLRDVTFDGGSAAKHGLNIYHAGTVTLENVEISNCRWYALVVNGTELSVDGLTTSGNLWGVNIDRGSRVTFANAAIAEGDSIVFEGQDTSGSLTVESGSYQNIKTQGGSTGGTIAINGGTVGSVVNDTAAEVTISGGTVTGQVANSGSGSISVTGGSFAAAELEDFIDPDQTVILTLELGEGATGAAVGALPTPERSGYAFAGWYTAADGGTAVTADTVFDANATLYARWTEKSEDGEHLITVDPVTGGSLEVSAGRADEGETVTITAAPDDGYELKKLTVTDSQDGAVPVQNAGEGRYTFVMPGSGVTVSASFVRSGEQTELPFTDVDSGAYYYDAVRWAVEQGIASGVTGTAFAPGRRCTRAQLVTFLWRVNGSPETTAKENSFTDVKPDSYYYKAVLWAEEQGITSGVTETAFAPDRVCTCAQATVLLWRAEGSPAASGTHDFRDVAEGAYYADAVAWAVESGVTQGTTSTTFEPGTTCTRAQIMTFLHRAMA
ncbi:S-layer homology domain-containing protein [Oscillibacter sp.]|uniref:S-layer homology domain-containing protein n=1 Tax=Oscillibacter sp. TaxID=1945593 RepID=UPI002D7F8DA5|nr:S-layer homology domain-containing protein [Oscillibacter sp.]MBS6353735.1 S-layer homology domain-containing protein [Oscillibacter sp.]